MFSAKLPCQSEGSRSVRWKASSTTAGISTFAADYHRHSRVGASPCAANSSVQRRHGAVIAHDDEDAMVEKAALARGLWKTPICSSTYRTIARDRSVAARIEEGRMCLGQQHRDKRLALSR
ncbi:MAG: hypothetical protein IPF61_07875 [Xanthomonadales bacterium]|nr:hypothetical protein [Xanthomonadales bacterium]